MSEQKHTPGRKANDLGYVGTASSESGWILISVPADGHFIKLPSDEEQKANIRLIAAAPELLSALQWILDHPYENLQAEAGFQARAAIHKATGN